MSNLRGVIDKTGNEVDVYAVGVLDALQTAGRALVVKGLEGQRLELARRSMRREWRYLWGYAIKKQGLGERNWRALRNTFNGYLAEHRHGGHNCGHAWTKKRALRMVEKLCLENACMRFHPDEVCLPGKNHPGRAD